ncbi:MAG: hypothetical protein IKM54_07335 [Butyricicoccus sp.]|nr:hypothetical protein [Butyricicoccus sp.]
MKRFARLLPLLCLFGLLCGCQLRSGEDLLAAPKPTEEFLALQTELDKELAEGAVYAAPVSGSNRNYIQLVDLNSDGRDEAIAFFRTSSMSNEFSIKVYEQQNDGSYLNRGAIAGVGVAIHEVNYPQFTSDGSRSIQITWQVTGETVLAMSVGAFHGDTVETLLAADYTNFVNVDLTDDKVLDLLVLEIDSTSGDKLATLYTFENGCRTAGTALLSPDAVSISRLITGRTDDRIAAFVEEKDESGIGQQTDILLYANGELHNIAYDSELAVAQDTYRSTNVNAVDIDGDGEIEIPRAVLMAGYPEGSADALYMFDWYAYRMGNAPEYKLTTFRSAAERWYIVIPEEWHDAVYATRGSMSGIATTTFYEYRAAAGEDPEAGEDIPLLTIYYLTGSSTQYQANQLGLTVLGQNDIGMWAAKIPEEAKNSPHAVTMSEVVKAFRQMVD